MKVVFTIIHFGEVGKILESKIMNEDYCDEKRDLVITHSSLKLTFSMCHGLKAFFAGVRPADVIFSSHAETEEDCYY